MRVGERHSVRWRTKNLLHGYKEMVSTNPVAGDHLCVDRGFYSHHGICIGQDKVVHFTSKLKIWSNVKETSLHAFKGAGSILVVDNEYRFRGGYRGDDPSESLLTVLPLPGSEWFYTEADPPHVVVARALRAVGQGGYNLLIKNCEHFAVWCRTGIWYSEQVREVITKGFSSDESERRNFWLRKRGIR